jgi:hypothetical protein
MAKRKTRNWFHPKVVSGWHKDEPQATRIRKLLRAHHGNLLSAARGKQALANVTRDAATKRAARADAKLLFARYKRAKK